MVDWFVRYKDVIGGIAGLATAIGLLATAAAISLAAVQIRQQRELSRAQAAYEVQRDAREFAWQLIADATLATAVFGREPDKGRAAIASVVNFYSAVFQMWRHGVLGSPIWTLFEGELTAMLQREEAREIWDEIKGGFDPAFVAAVDGGRARTRRRR